MKLFYKEIGEGKPLVILHGLFGQSDNWNTMGKKFAEQGFHVFLVDLRNHGKSPHSDEWNYDVMTSDVLQLINEEEALKGEEVILLGHSMGGKVAMNFAINHPEKLEKLIVADMTPRYRVPDNGDVLDALNAVDLSLLKSRKEVGGVLSEYLKEQGLIQFLLKNVYWKKDLSGGDDVLAWKFNWDAMKSQMGEISKEINANNNCSVRTLFVRGANSDYVLDEDIQIINELFSNSQVETIEGAGHWLHAEQPTRFFDRLIEFLD